MAASYPTLQRLKELLVYDPETGIFTRRTSRGGFVAGTPAGCAMQIGYILICIDRERLLAHRLAWLITHGRLPRGGEIDHIDGNRSNNRLANLREVTRTSNMQNRRSSSRNNKLGVLGVCAWRGYFIAQIHANGQHTHLGYFKTVEAAQSAYLAAKRKLHPGFVE